MAGNGSGKTKNGGGTSTPRTDPSRRGVTQVSGTSKQGSSRASGSTKPAAKPSTPSRTAPTKPAGKSGSGKPGSGKYAGNVGTPGRAAPRGRRSISPAMWGWGAGAIVLVAVLVIVLVAVTKPAPKNTSTTTSASPAAVRATTNVPAAVLDHVGIGSPAHPAGGSGDPLAIMKTAHAQGNGLPPVDGKPVVFYFGALYCPYCATERWGMVVALSRFGTFHNLNGAASSSTDVYPSTQTWSFYGSTYTSPYIDFQPVEAEGEQQQPLQSLTAEQNQVLNTWDPIKSFPFLTIGQKYTAGLPAWMSPQFMQSLSREQIAQTLSMPSNQLGNAVDANANYLSAAICAVDGGKPGNVCNSAGVQAAMKQLPKLAAAKPITQ